MTRNPVKKFSRGKFLQLCIRISIGLAGALGLIGLVRYFSYRPEHGSPNNYNLGSVDDFPVSGRLVRLDIPAVIYKTGQGFQGYSLICTHLGCTLEESEGGFSCPCHGSSFDPEGRVIKGPARDDLTPLDIEITKTGELLIRINGAGI